MIVFLIAFPLIVAALLLVVRQDSARNLIVYAGSGVIALASVAVALLNLGAPTTLIPSNRMRSIWCVSPQAA